MLARSSCVTRLGLLGLLLCCFTHSTPAAAQAIKPWFLIVLDTSGSMCENDVNVANSCGFTPTIKMNAAKCAIQNTLNQTGDAEFGLAQFSQTMTCGAGTSNDTAASGLMRIAISPTGAASILPLVDGAGAPAGACNADGSMPAAGNNTLELCSGGATPTSGTLRMVQDYFQGNVAGFNAPTEDNNTALGCRPMSVILLTDGMSNGGGTPSDRAAELRTNMRVPSVLGQNCPAAGGCVSVPIRTYPIGFGIASGNAEIESIATQGGTDNSSDGVGGIRGYYAGDEIELSEAFAQIIFDSQLNEVCNGVDDDCDSLVDEGSAAYCDADGIRSANPLVPHPTTGALVDQETTVSVTGVQSNIDTLTCSIAGSMCVGMSGNALITCCANTMSCCDVVDYDTTPPMGDLAICAAPEWASKNMCSPKNRLCESPGEICDGEDNDCDGDTDEGPFIGTVPPELCNNTIDDDCDGNTDEGCAGCVPETCNDDDDDCDGLVDEDLTRACGFDLGSGFPDSICEAGQQTCVKAQWGAVCPSGTINGPTCSVAIADTARDVGDPFPTGWVNMGGTCVFDTAEVCDDLDNNCNTLVDDIPGTACTSGSIALGLLLPNGRGICRAGQQFCDPSEGDLLGPCQFEVLPTAEICNGLDDDCDTFTDEAAGVNPTHTPITRACGTDAGICSRGTETCNSMTGVFGACMGATTGTTETCNAVSGAPDQTLYDEDCDSRTDESDPAIPGACVPNMSGAPAPGPLPGNANTGECEAGSVQCVSGGLRCSNYTGPTPELCDALDQDCNGNNTNGVGPTTTLPNGAAGTDPSLGTPCFPASYSGSFPQALPGLGQCTPGRLVCNTTTEMTTCAVFGTPSVEICDGIDNDCDAAVDEGVYGPTDTCQSTPPHNPVRSFCGECVSAGGEVVTCRQSLVDDVAAVVTCGDLGYGAAISHGGVADCCGAYAFTSSWDFGDLVGPHDGDGECSLGLLRCVNGDEICDGEVIPVDELCDGDDNDCDGNIDETLPTEGQPCGDDTGECDLGQLVCTGGGGMVCMGETTGNDELCDGLDNDCDGFYDEENPGGGAQCGGNTENCVRRMDPSNTTQAETEPCGDCDWGVEICVTLFDANDLPIDGEIQCLGDTGPRDETCDGRDNDCDSKCLVSGTGVVTCPPEIPDADDKIDEGVDVTDPNVGLDCGEEEGECEAGSLVCTGGGLVCEGGEGPTLEVCNGLDDDCDTIPDDGIPVGAPCGSDVGECSPGHLVCDPDIGEPVCQGEIGPGEEICDGLDNNCNGMVDEGLGVGDACGSDVGECMQGRIECVNGRDRCVGETVPGFEVCDCLDNDCDGEIDEDSGATDICGGTAACVECQCALPCTEAGEFATRCPQGKAPVVNDEGCFCVGSRCEMSECAAETLEEENGELRCAPDSATVGSCQCYNNECRSRCAGVVCGDGLVCDKTDGSCKQPTCLLAQFACTENQRCARIDSTFSCVADACANVTCEDDEACRLGDCFKSCARVTCETGESCTDGECAADPCAGVTCRPGEACEPSSGDCVDAGECVRTGCTDGEVCNTVEGSCAEDPCLATHCPYGEQCDSESSQCELRCAANLLFCEDGCANPLNSREHCGASLDCRGENAGEQCAEGLVCSRGECSDTCADGLVNCGGECIDAQTDLRHCGATADCEGANDGNVCQTGFSCVAGACEPNNPGAGGNGGAGGVPDGTRVIASGGGGCTCSVPGASSEQGGSTRGMISMALFALGLALLGRRKPRKLVLTLSQIALFAVAASSLVETGCSVDTFCLDCPSPGDDMTPDGGGLSGGSGGTTGGTGGGGSGGVGGAGADGGPDGGGGTGGTGGDGSVPTPDGGCVDTELCNGIDDDCDDKVDEGADPAAVGIDVATDALHCGGCGLACSIEHAFNKCEDSECAIDRTQGENGCDIGYFDLDTDEENGCEYRCTKTTDDDANCDLIDNDCDMQIDEDVAFATDPDNCGSCGLTCRFANATAGGRCVAEVCALDDTQCDSGFKNLDGVAENGCERRCPTFPTVDELCNLVDDDCDGDVDEDVAATDPMVGDACGTNAGECTAGTTVCVAGAIFCNGEVGAETEVCDGDDNDCDGDTDESDPLLSSNPACGSSIGACERGVLVCSGGDIECGGATFVGPAAVETCNRIDDDCDGLVDEESVINDGGTLRELEDGIACSTRSGMLDITPSSAAQGLCSYGTLACQSGQLACRNEVLPAVERCDNIDSDCDGLPVPANLATLVDPAVGVVCSNQLGICATGTPGRTQCVNAGTVGSPNWQVQCSAGSVTPLPNEICNGLDDNCNGTTDENAVGVGTNNCHLEDSNGDGVFETYVGTPLNTGECDSGDTYCTGGVLACIGFVRPRVEVCNGLDDDCDTGTPGGGIDEGSQHAATPCNALSGTFGSTNTWDLLGACTAGTWTCPAAPATAALTGLQCIGGTRPAATESCNNTDDDCDGDVDEDWVPMGAQPLPGSTCCPNDPSTPHVDVCNAAGAAFASCRPGANQCAGGTVSCIQTQFTPSAEVCDLAAPQRDNDCDGVIDEGYRTGMVYSNIDNCGGCGIDCRSGANQADNAIMACLAGSCEIVTCDGGYFDDPNVVGEDCDLFCPAFAGDIELCDGEDNDCDGSVDEVADLQGPVGSTFCDQDGACAGAQPICTDIGSGVKGWTCDRMPAANELCTFNMGTPGVSTVDEDCDGRVDESLTIKTGFSAGAQGVGVTRSCTGPGNGECQATGVQICDSTNTTRTKCVVSLGNLTEVTENTANRANEVCDGEDNDCDGQADEPCEDAGGLCMPNDMACITANTSGGVLGCVIDDFAQLDSDTWIYAYEASRPDANGSTQGSGTARSCADVTRKPWTNVSYDDAVNACEAAGARLCARSEWRQACDCGGTGTTGSPLNYDYQWPSAGACTAVSATATTQCNIADASNAIDASGASTSCYRTHNSTSVFDLSGNVKELTLAQDTIGADCDPATDNTCRIQTRGGASSNTAVGAACGYDKSYWPDDAPFYNVGFRCCSGPDPRTVCTTYAKTGLPTTVGNGATLNSVIAVPTTGTVARVRILNLTGDHTVDDMDDADLFLVGPTGTVVNLFQDKCNNDDAWAMRLQDGSTSVNDGTFCNGNTVGTSVSTAWAPEQPLSVFNGLAGTGNWTLRVTDDDSGGASGQLVLQSWSIEICAAP